MSSYFRRKESNRIWIWIADIVATVLTALSFLNVVTSQLGLSLNPAAAFHGGVISGMVAAWNSVADTLGSSNYVLLTKYAGAGNSYGLFLTVLCVVLILIALFVIKSRFLLALLIFALPQTLLALIYGLYPSSGALIFNVISLIFAVIVIRMPGAVLQAAVPAAVIALVFVIFFAAFGKDKISIPLKGEAGENVVSFAGNLIYGYDDLGHGDLSARTRKVREGEALKVQMQTVRPMYLKGFTGAQFDGIQWKDLADSVYYNALEMNEKLRREGFYAPGQLAQASGFVFADETRTKNEIHVENTGADKRCAYVPYDLTDSGSLSDAAVKGGDGFYAGPLGSFPTGTYTVCEDQTDNWTDSAAAFFEAALNTGDNRPEGIDDYLRMESHYNVFVYNTFKKLTKAERAALHEAAGDSGNQSEGHLNYKEAITKVRTFLEDNFIYSEDLGEPLNENGSRLREFFDSHKGYDIHYATAATLLFRYYGIPARYAEGYLITPQDAESAEGTVSVLRSRAHAWTEIYIDGIGFVPLEVTPEFYGVMPEADLEAGISNEVLENAYKEKYGTPSGNTHLQSEERPPEISEETQRLLWTILVIIIVIVLLILALLLARKLARKVAEERKRRRLFYKSDPNTAVAAIYDYMETKGFPLEQSVIDLGNYAAFSPYKVTEKERDYMLRTLQEMKKNKK